MAEETHFFGDEVPYVVTLRQLDRTPYDLSGCRVWMVHGWDGPEIEGSVPDPLLGVALFDLSQQPRSGNAVRTTVHVEWSDGTTETVVEFGLRIK